jgi:hypothetical protein
VQIDYRGHDSLGRLLNAPAPPLLEPEPAPPPPAGAILLQLYCRAPGPADADRALGLAAGISKVYGGSPRISRASGITVRFEADDEFEGPFRALCCAQLLQQLGQGHYQLALTALAAADDGNPWLEQRAVEQAQQACVQATEDAVLIDNALQRHPAIGERTALAPSQETEAWWQVNALLPPYDTLLQRQLQALQAQLPTP